MPSLFDGTEGMTSIGDIYRQLEKNCPDPASTSKKLWQLRRKTDISDCNQKLETLLEKSVAMLAENGHMPGWYNQCPTASGIAGPRSDKHSNVDLVQWHPGNDSARLVELKWGSNTPADAIHQVLRYGAAYVYCRVHRDRLPVEGREIMDAHHIELCVAAPMRYYRGCTDKPLRQALDSLRAFDVGSRIPGLSMSLDVLALPKHFDRLPFSSGTEVSRECDQRQITDSGRLVRDAFDGLQSVFAQRVGNARQSMDSTDRFLPCVPAAAVEAAFDAAPGNEMQSGKFDSPESSAALAANAFGFFLERPCALPALPGCEQQSWPAVSLRLECELRFPWRGGRHPVLDVVATTPSALIGIESKRYEPYRSKPPPTLSDAYWRPVWGTRMAGYEGIRDALRRDPKCYAHLDAAQLFKHALALRAAVQPQAKYEGLTPILFYVYAEPDSWYDGRPIAQRDRERHAEEIRQFAAAVAGNEVRFVACSYRQLLDAWSNCGDDCIRTHAAAVARRFSP